MTQQLTVLLVDQNAHSLAAVKRSLSNFTDLEVVGDAGFGPVALTWARSLEPDLVIVVAEEPLALPLGTIRTLSQGTPTWTVVALAGQFERDLFRKAVVAGARDVLLRSFSPAEMHDGLVNARRADISRRTAPAHDPSAPAGTVITVFGAKGGIGKTTIAANLAVSLAQLTSRSVALVDLELQFGDIAMTLDLKPERDVLGALDEGVLEDPDRLQAHLLDGPEGVHVLPAPPRPDEGSSMDGRQVVRLLNRLAALHDFVVADTPPGLNETTAAALDASALALLVSTPEVPSLRRTQACLWLLQSWDYPVDKVKLVLNRASSRTRVSEAEAESVLGQPIAWRVSNDYAAMLAAAYGHPVVLAQPETPLAMSVRSIARQLAGLPEPQSSGWFSWLLRPAAATAAQP